eukprot:4405727-Alexandrium_andersonii.AAC.1
MDGIEEVRDEDVVIVGGRQGGLSAGSATSRDFFERLRQRTVHANKAKAAGRKVPAPYSHRSGRPELPA